MAIQDTNGFEPWKGFNMNQPNQNNGSVINNDFSNFGDWGNPKSGAGAVGGNGDPSMWQKGGMLDGIFGKDGWGSAAMSGALGVGQLFMGAQQMSMAKKQFNFTKEAFYTNLQNSVKSYNNQISDKINSRYSDREKSQEDKDKIIKEQSL